MPFPLNNVEHLKELVYLYIAKYSKHPNMNTKRFYVLYLLRNPIDTFISYNVFRMFLDLCI